MEAWNAYCFIQPTFMYCTEDIQIDIPLQFTNISVYLLHVRYKFLLTVINVNKTHDDSSFSCSIVSEQQPQWKHTAHLNVSSLYNGHNTDHDTTMIVAVATSAFVVLVCGVAVVVLVEILATKRFKAAQTRTRSPDQGSLLHTV